jgi:hydroxymethylglutaryl-CoA lyase
VGSPRGAKAPVSRQALGQAQALRRAMTGPEHGLWAALSNRRVRGAKFRRQHPFGPYILDFYCHSHRLVVEVDGLTHRSPEARTHDEARTGYLESYGLRVERYSDDAVIHNLGTVLHAITRALEEIELGRKPTPQPPPSGTGLRRPVEFSALVPNERGLASALDVNRAARRDLIGKVSVFTAASETFSTKNTNASIAESIERFKPVIASAHQSGLVVRGYVSCAIACPFEGPISPMAVADVSEKLASIGVDEVDLGDTIGAATPASIAAVIDEVVGRLGEGWLDEHLPGEQALTVHLHDTFGRAAECVKVALDAGVRSFDGSVAGLGGCPYASTPGKRAPGNISTELLVRTVHDAGYETGVDLNKLADAAAFARQIVAKAREEAGA